MFIRLIITDLKRISGYGAYLLLTASILTVLVLVLAFKADDIIYSGRDNEPLSIGIVMSADSSISDMAYTMVEDMDSYRSMCSFTEVTDKDTALADLKTGKYYAVIYVPDNIISDIMDGTNTPVEVYYSDPSSPDSFILNDLFRSTSSMLGISQAAIYSVQALGRELELTEGLQAELSAEVNSLFLKCVLSRAYLFATTEINATRAASTTAFYVSASILVLMGLCGIIFIPFVKSVPASLRNRLKAAGVGRLRQLTSAFISIFVWEYLLYLAINLVLVVVSAVGGDISITMSFDKLAVGIYAAAAVSLAVLIISLIPAGIHGCTLLLVVVVILMAYFSGFLIPETMLPDFAKALCHHSPLNQLAQMLCKQ